MKGNRFDIRWTLSACRNGKNKMPVSPFNSLGSKPRKAKDLCDSHSVIFTIVMRPAAKRGGVSEYRNLFWKGLVADAD